MHELQKMKGYKYAYTNIKGKLGRYKLWIADTQLKKEKGLSGIKTLNRKEGMLFVYNDEDYRTFTMKNTFIPLLIIFCNQNFEVLQIERGIPQSNRKITSKDKVKYVIEILDK